MKIAVTSQGDTLDSAIDQRFGRANGFIIVDSETMDYRYVENTQNLQSASGAGIQAAQKMANEKVDILITGNCGPKAFATLKVSAVGVITGAQGTVRECIEKWKKGELQPTDSANVNPHW